MLTALGMSAGCGTDPDYESDLLGSWEGTFRSPGRGGSAVEVVIEDVRDGVLSGTGRLGFTGVGMRWPVTGTWDPPLLQIIITGEEDAYFSMVTRLEGGTMVGRALSTFSASGAPGGAGDVILSRRVSSVTGGGQ